MKEDDPKPASGITQFHYLKSNYHRVVHVDGVYGGPSPTGDAVIISFFNERVPIPTIEWREIIEGHVGECAQTETRTGVVREIETTTLIPLRKARAIAEWLLKQVEATENAHKQIAAMKEAKGNE